MNLQEFSALKVGDRIENSMSSSQGDIVATSETGVRVRWDGRRTDAGPTFFYSVQGTAWFHWSKVEDNDETKPMD